MIKKFISALASVAILFAVAGCSSSEEQHQQRVCQEIADAMSNQEFDKVAKLSGSLYEKLPECSVKTLGDLTMSYITLSAVGIAENDEPTVVESMRKAIDCYDEAMKKNPTEANKLWDEMSSKKNDQGFSINPTEIIEIFRQQISAYDSQLMSAVDSTAVSDETALDETVAISED